ncbi:hypothetical protein BT69DRAFT_1276500 [Atractiella rhizophila]|nr:hypothetical protein BT69DRAFT_1276500 [Atractiella rhizophila]
MSPTTSYILALSSIFALSNGALTINPDFFSFGARFQQVLVEERVDPLVSPGKVSQHAHRVHGSSAFSWTPPTSAQMQAANCTSEDKSIYWHPMLYFSWANGSYTAVEGGPTFYYNWGSEKLVSSNVTAFPENFRILAGDNSRRTLDQAIFDSRTVYWTCGSDETDSPGLPEKYCNVLYSKIQLPTCWDGVNAFTSDQSHMTYGAGSNMNSGGTCPSSHPVKLPRIFAELNWQTAAFQSFWSQAANPKQPFVLANGDTTGFSYHFDFMAGWGSTLGKMMNRCGCTDDELNAQGLIGCCKAKGILHDEQGTCKIPQQVVENVSGIIPKLVLPETASKTRREWKA